MGSFEEEVEGVFTSTRRDIGIVGEGREGVGKDSQRGVSEFD